MNFIQVTVAFPAIAAVQTALTAGSTASVALQAGMTKAISVLVPTMVVPKAVDALNLPAPLTTVATVVLSTATGTWKPHETLQPEWRAGHLMGEPTATLQSTIDAGLRVVPGAILSELVPDPALKAGVRTLINGVTHARNGRLSFALPESVRDLARDVATEALIVTTSKPLERDLGPMLAQHLVRSTVNAGVRAYQDAKECTTLEMHEFNESNLDVVLKPDRDRNELIPTVLHDVPRPAQQERQLDRPQRQPAEDFARVAKPMSEVADHLRHSMAPSAKFVPWGGVVDIVLHTSRAQDRGSGHPIRAGLASAITDGLISRGVIALVGFGPGLVLSETAALAHEYADKSQRNAAIAIDRLTQCAGDPNASLLSRGACTQALVTVQHGQILSGILSKLHAAKESVIEQVGKQFD